MKDVTIKLGIAEAQILRNELLTIIAVKEELKNLALCRMHDGHLDLWEREIARENNELLSCQIGLYRDICGQILKSVFMSQ